MGGGGAEGWVVGERWGGAVGCSVTSGALALVHGHVVWHVVGDLGCGGALEFCFREAVTCF
jgi:hypothetical protein